MGRFATLLIGDGDDRPRIEAMVQNMRLEKAVIFAGFVPDEEMVDHFRLGDAFAMPSTEKDLASPF